SYTVHLKAGEFLQASVEQRNVDVIVTLHGSQGTKLLEMDTGNGSEGKEQLFLIAKATGQYKLTVSSRRTEAKAGRYELGLVVRPSVGIDKKRVDAQQAFLEASETDTTPAAVAKYNLALRLWQEAGEVERQIVTLKSISSAYWASGDRQKSAESLIKALPLIRTQDDRRAEAETMRKIGWTYDFLGNKQKAVDYLMQALSILQAIGERRSEAARLRDIGRLYDDLEENRKALDFYNRSLPLLRALGDTRGEAAILNTVGLVHSVLGEKQKALECFEQVLQLRKVLGDIDGEATTLNNVGLVYSELGQSPKALDFYNQALSLRRVAKDRLGEAVTLGNIGLVYSNLGEKQKALGYYKQALPLQREMNNQRGEAVTLKNIGMVYDFLGEKQKALEHFNQALVILRKVGNRRIEALTLNSIGALYFDLGEKQKALDFFMRALPVLRTIGDRSGEAATLNNLGAVYDDLNEKEKALGVYNQVLALIREVGDRRREATTLDNIGKTYSTLGDNKKALDFFRQALPLRRAVGDRAGEATTLNNLGTTYDSLGEKDRALDFYSQALPIYCAVGSGLGEAASLNNLMVLLHKSNPRIAIFYGKLTINVLQKLRSTITGFETEVQKSFLRMREDPYRLLANILISEGRLSEAHQVINLFKDQQFLDFQTQKHALPLTLSKREELLAERYDKALAKAIRELTKTKRQTVDEVARAKEIEEQWRNDSPEFLAFLRGVERDLTGPASDSDEVAGIADTLDLQTSLRQLNKQTGQNAVAVYTLIDEDSYRALVITPENISTVTRRVKENSLNEKSLQLWALLQTARYDPVPLARDLYATIFKPLEPQLPKDTNTILWSLDGNLRYVPMAALHDGKQYLIERYNHVVFTRADSERMLRAVSARWTGLGLGSSQAHTVEILGDKIRFNALPGVTEELRALFRQKDSPGGLLDGEVLPDARFTKAAMLSSLKQKRPLVHISSHFSFRPGDESRSFLLLGDGSAMTLEDLKAQPDLFAGVELLTLSACNTAAQQAGATGREIDGFAELAQRLGAGSVMATLWPVADNSTPWLMHEFYQTRQSGKA
ncbi:MAG: CHAT domain-containing tetratricopeptide repeat protein, partial [Pyrinomonadaceae bacterium]